MRCRKNKYKQILLKRERWVERSASEIQLYILNKRNCLTIMFYIWVAGWVYLKYNIYSFLVDCICIGNVQQRDPLKTFHSSCPFFIKYGKDFSYKQDRFFPCATVNNVFSLLKRKTNSYWGFFYEMYIANKNKHLHWHEGTATIRFVGLLL